MQNQAGEGAQQAKRQYRKPELTQIELRPHEAVLGNCKTGGVGGPITTNCGLVTCFDVGS